MQSKAFVKNQLRDVVYSQDLLKAIDMSLNVSQYTWRQARGTGISDDFMPYDKLLMYHEFEGMAPHNVQDRLKSTLIQYLELLMEALPPLRNGEMDWRLRAFLRRLRQHLLRQFDAGGGICQCNRFLCNGGRTNSSSLEGKPHYPDLLAFTFRYVVFDSEMQAQLPRPFKPCVEGY